jgi:transcriptional regulator with XRE-family HTH domain
MTDERLRKLVARRIQQLRRKAGLTQEDMRDHGFGYRHYQRLEAGEKDLRLSTLNRIANTFKIPVRDLLDFD